MWHAGHMKRAASVKHSCNDDELGAYPSFSPGLVAAPAPPPGDKLHPTRSQIPSPRSTAHPIAMSRVGRPPSFHSLYSSKLSAPSAIKKKQTARVAMHYPCPFLSPQIHGLRHHPSPTTLNPPPPPHGVALNSSVCGDGWLASISDSYHGTTSRSGSAWVTLLWSLLHINTPSWSS
jgi:hypothetical protein